MTTHGSAAQNLSTAECKKSPARRIGRGVLVAAVIGTFMGATSGVAAAVSGDTDTGPTTGNVHVTTSIILSDLPADFTLAGVPSATVSAERAVTMTVATNNIAGYNVTVQSRTPTLVGTGGNQDSIPIGTLRVREHHGVEILYAPMTTTAQTVHSQATPSAALGDAIINDYQVTIPFVNPDTYSATLDYVATAN